jgi:heme-degrading monooxygenase HmoA
VPSVVKINVLTVPEGMRAELERRFAGRAGMVEAADGFEWFELLRPVEGTDRYLVYTRWRSEQDFERWHASQAFERGHAQARAERPDGDQQAGGGSGPAGQHGSGSEPGPGSEHRPPAASGSEIWSFEVIQSAPPAAR